VYAHARRKYCGDEKIDLEVLTDLYFFSPLRIRKEGELDCRLSVCMYVCMCVYVCMYVFVYVRMDVRIANA
jgi:hypothetical protein